MDAPMIPLHPQVPERNRRITKEDYVLSHTTDAAHVEAVSDAGMNVVPVHAASEKLLETIVDTLDQEKAEEIVSIPLRGKSSMADHMVVCSGRSSRQVAALSEKLTDRLKQDFGVLCKVEGKEQGDWVLIDAGDVIVHVFRPEVREFYQLEKMWMSPGAPAPANA